MSKKDHVLTVEVLDQSGSTFTLREICERGECHAEFVIKLVNFGIIAPLEDLPETVHWQFDIAALSRLRKAQRLQRDLKMNLPGLAMSLELLDEVETMRRKVARLEQRLAQQSPDQGTG
jgi:chaperone modulatory protein CbpM